MLWALATLKASSRLSLQCADAADLERLEGQAAANSMWALAVLRPQRLPLLLQKELVLSPQETVNGLWALATAGFHDENFFEKAKKQLVSRKALESLAESGNLLCNVVWAFSFARELLGRDEDDSEFLALLRSELLALGRRRDEQSTLQSTQSTERGSERGGPKVLRRGSGVAVIYKPPGWEVDGEISTSTAYRLFTSASYILYYILLPLAFLF